nr:hypothetical protein [Micromonospora globbae]
MAARIAVPELTYWFDRVDGDLNGFGVDVGGADGELEGSEVGASGPCGGHDGVDVFGGYVVDEADALHGEVKPLVRDDVEAWLLGQ